MTGLSIKFFAIISLTFLLISCTEEIPQEDPPAEQVQAPITPSVEPNEDPTSEEISQQIVNEIEQLLKPEDQEEATVTVSLDQVEAEETDLTEVSDAIEDAGATSEATSNEDTVVSDALPEAQETEVATTESDIEEQSDTEQPTGTVEVKLTPEPREFDEFGRSVSDEQDFAAVAQRETIESDSQRIKEIEEKLVIYDPIDHPDKEGQTDVVSFALNTKHTPGTVLFRRNTLFFNRDKYLERCESYIDSEAAQQAFLDAGGPEVDELNLDPDGDGFACSWNPEKYRLVLQ